MIKPRVVISNKTPYKLFLSQMENNEVLAIEANELAILRFEKQRKKIYNLSLEKYNCLFISGVFMIDEVHRI